MKQQYSNAEKDKTILSDQLGPTLAGEIVEAKKSSGIKGHSARSMIIDEVSDWSVVDESTQQAKEAASAELAEYAAADVELTNKTLDELQRLIHLPRAFGRSSYAQMLETLDAAEQGMVQTRIASGRAAAQIAGFNTAYKKKLPKLSISRDGAELHRKAVERRRKRKNGGPK